MAYKAEHRGARRSALDRLARLDQQLGEVVLSSSMV
jgi:hypothetical protein